MGVSVSKVDFEIIVKTGDVKGAGTDSNVYCKLHDKSGNESHDIKLDCIWRDDFEKGSLDSFPVKNIDHLGRPILCMFVPDYKEKMKIKKITRSQKF